MAYLQLNEWARDTIDKRGVLNVVCQFRSALDDGLAYRNGPDMAFDLLADLNTFCNRWIDKNTADPKHPLTNGE